jgi:FtsH-binding integral membrane protein
MSDFDRFATSRYGGRAARAGAAAIDQGLRSYMLGVYNNMMLGLGVTGLVALGANMLSVVHDASGRIVALTDFGAAIYTSPLKWVIMIAPLAFVFIFSMRIDRMSAASARNMFLGFAATMGLSLSTILLIYTQQSVYLAFFETAASFGALSLYGYTTKRDLSPIGSFLIMGLFGLVIASIVNIFVHSSGFQFALSLLTLAIFAGLTAWDTQAIKEMYYESDSYEVATKKSINGALRLYLDFVNIFTALIQLTGNRNN